MQHLQSALHVLVLDHLGQDILLEGAGEVVLQQLVVIDRIDVLASTFCSLAMAMRDSTVYATLM
jgi:hypothetical protein